MKVLNILSMMLLAIIMHGQSDSSLAESLQLAESLHFYTIPEELQNGKLTQDSLIMRRELARHAEFEDSISGNGLVLYSSQYDLKKGRRFLLFKDTGDSLYTCAFHTSGQSEFQSLTLHFVGNTPVLELRYKDDQGEGEQVREWRISAFFAVEKERIKPLARLVQAVWVDDHGSYNPDCKDFSFHSSEMRRKLRIRKGELRVAPARYREASNMNCEYQTSETTLAGASYQLGEAGFTKK